MSFNVINGGMSGSFAGDYIRKQIAEKEACEMAKTLDQTCSRERTVGEELDARIDFFERRASALRDLKGSLPGNFLNSGVSRIAGLL